MSARRTYTQETLDAISKRFEEVPAAPITATYSAFALVRKLVTKIRRMTQNGYSWEAIAAMMADEGVKLSGNALRKYVTQGQDMKKNKNGGGKRADTSKPSRTPAASRSLLGSSTAPLSSHREVDAKDEAWDEIETFPENQEHHPLAPPARPARPSGTFPRSSMESPKASSAPAASSSPRSSLVVGPDTDEI